MIASWLAASVIAFPFSIKLIKHAGRLFDHLIFLHPTEAFIIRFQISLISGVIFVLPIWMYHGLKFLWNGLTGRERRGLVITCASVLVLSFIGLAFADQVLLPVSVRFLLEFGNETLVPMLSAQHYMSFYCGILLFCCLLFNLPFVIMALAVLRVIHISWLVMYRKHVCVGCFIVSAILTPPDIVTQIVLALPLYVLYESSILAVRIFVKSPD